MENKLTVYRRKNAKTLTVSSESPHFMETLVEAKIP